MVKRLQEIDLADGGVVWGFYLDLGLHFHYSRGVKETTFRFWDQFGWGSYQDLLGPSLEILVPSSLRPLPSPEGFGNLGIDFSLNAFNLVIATLVSEQASV